MIRQRLCNEKVYTAIIHKDPTVNVISFPKSVSYYLVPLFIHRSDKTIDIKENNLYDIEYHDDQDSVIYIPYKLAYQLDNSITTDDTCIEYVHVFGFALTIGDVCAIHKELQHIEWNSFNIAESYKKVQNQYAHYKKGMIIVPKALNEKLPHIKYIGYFNFDNTGKIYPTDEYDIRASTTDDHNLYISPDLANQIGIPEIHTGQLICFGTYRKGEEMDIEEERNIAKSESLKRFQLPTRTLNKSFGADTQVILSIPFQYFMTIRPLFCNIVDSLKKEVEDSIIKNVEFNTTISGHTITKSGSINKIELNSVYFEDLIYRALSVFNVSTDEVHFTLDCTGNNSQYIEVDPDDFGAYYGNLFNFCEEYTTKWIEDNNIEAVIKLGDTDIGVDKLQICNAPTALLETYDMNDIITDKILSDLDIIEVEIIQTEDNDE